MTKTKHAWALAALPMAIGLASITGSAHGASFNIGGIDGQFDSQMSIGASVSTSNADRRFIHTLTQIDGESQRGEAAARTSDDGRLNYEAGDVFSKIFKIGRAHV